MTTKEMLYEQMVELGGGVFLGVKEGPLVLFAGRRESDPILSIHPDQLSAEAVRRAIAAKHEELEEAELVLTL